MRDVKILHKRALDTIEKLNNELERIEALILNRDNDIETYTALIAQKRVTAKKLAYEKALISHYLRVNNEQTFNETIANGFKA